MTKNKYDFIKELLEDKKLNQNQQERIFELASKEISIEGSLEERIQKIEGIIFKNSPPKNNSGTTNNSNNDKNPPNENDIPKSYYYPSSLYKFLIAYNKDDVLKTTCHKIDSFEIEKINSYCNTKEYDFKKHYNAILKSYSILEKSFAPTYIKSLIRGYLTGKDYYGNNLKKGWSDYGIKYNWGMTGLIEWSENNPNIPPNPDEGFSETIDNLGFEFENPIEIKGEFYPLFKDFVILFKRMFHVREDNSLLEIIKKENEYKGWNIKIDFQIDENLFPENIEIFTDVDKVLQSYNTLLSLIVEFKKEEKPKVKLKLYENGKSVFFSINHVNSQFGKSLESCKVRLIGQKYGSIIDKLNGICNIYLKADFGQNQYAKFAIWDKKWNTQNERNVLECYEDFKGVEHILEFQRK
ncbi:MAG: hypothetical protein ACTH3E_11325 [Psychroflexus halocasei]